MNKPANIEAAPLALLRKPFEPHQISKLPKPTKAQTDAVKADYKKGIRCQVCQAWHHPDAIHLDYVGHAALTDRLLDTDMDWSWEPVGFTPEGLPAHDRTGGLWIKLTVCGVTRYGYGAADGKTGGDAVKEIIGDALRNAAMRFGAALDLWHKGDLHVDADEAPANDANQRINNPVPHEKKPRAEPLKGKHTSKSALQAAIKELVHNIRGCGDVWQLDELLNNPENVATVDQCQEEHKDWYFGWAEQPDGFVPLGKLITDTRNELDALENNPFRAG